MYDQLDERGVPVSKGVPTVVHVAVVIGILLIFAIGAFVIAEASFGHVWPSLKSLRIPL